MKRLALPLIALLLAGCGPDPKRLQVATPPRQPLSEQVPDSAFTCKERPDGSWVKTYRDVTDFIVELDDAFEDCKTKLEAAGRIVKGTR